MDATVDDFLNEINEIVPPLKKTEECEWQECFDDGSGFPYYWNISTNEVTWEMPLEYKKWLASGKKSAKPPSFLPTRDSSESKAEPKHQLFNIIGSRKPPPKKKPPPSRPKSSDSEDEKIVLISSYGGDTESEEEEDNNCNKNEIQTQQTVPSLISSVLGNTSKSNSSANSDADEDAEEKLLIQKIKDKTKILQELNATNGTPSSNGVENVTSTGFALVAGYGNDSDEEEDAIEEKKNLTVTSEETKVSHSTLFPITKPIDVSQFPEPKTLERYGEVEDINTKAFQRKRRIDVCLVNVPRKPSPTPKEEGERKGFGFNSECSSVKSGSVAFVKSETLFPNNEGNIAPKNVQEQDKREIDKDQTTLKEKLSFLSEGKEAVSPVQTMLIQLETLYAALKYGSLNSDYLNRWIKETCEELVKLEEEAAPGGWLLEWDRSQKRYYYRHKVTGECQWNYPVNVEDDAMDISTTPPPQMNDVIEQDVPTVSPGSPTPPPPPNITTCEPKQESPIKSEEPALASIVLPQFPEGQPLPPGVDPHESSEIKEPSSNDLNSVLDSFYSDIAAIEKSIPPNSSSTIEPRSSVTQANKDESMEPVKKKKKIKMATGIAMKKKGVSKLVEKWKNVQKDLD